YSKLRAIYKGGAEEEFTSVRDYRTFKSNDKGNEGEAIALSLFNPNPPDIGYKDLR
ncbi:3818_t:CDS:2, partial [Scutellospora calospora]